MLTDKDYCDYDTCVALKELGYPTKMTFIGEQATIEIPINSGLIQLYDAQKWLRENRNLHVEVGYNPVLSWYVYRVWEHQDEIAEGEAFPSYEEALSTAIYMAVEYLKEKNNGN